MDAKVISIDNGCKRQLLKQVQCFLIALLVVQMQHLLSEVVTLSAVSRLMVTSKQKDVVRIADFQAEEIGNDLWLVLASINVVAQENKFLVHSLVWEANLSQYVEQVEVLAMNVANDVRGIVNSQYIGLSAQDYRRLLADADEGIVF